jgi:hypothetical protein
MQALKLNVIIETNIYYQSMTKLRSIIIDLNILIINIRRQQYLWPRRIVRYKLFFKNI